MADFNLFYPEQTEGKKTLTIKSGSILFLVGANGTGKSTLMHLFNTQHQGSSRRITAHRQVWLNSDTVDLTPATRQQSEQNISHNDRQEDSRWKDTFANQRSQTVIFDLIDSENVEARKIADAARSGDMDCVSRLAKDQSPISKMNDILKISNLNFQISIEQGSKLIAIREGCQNYSIAQLSDGERNAILIIANVLTAPKETLILLDEPERHLHRSIVSPLISTLLVYREDCAFVISTHDVSLPHDQEKSSALLLRSYRHNPKSWTTDHIESVDSMDEKTSAAVLGARRKILFIEGHASSLDLQLYQILFPSITIKPLGSCLDVERVVRGIFESQSNHWLKAYGIIDRDNRSTTECEELEKIGIFPLAQYSIESLYYHPSIVQAILKRISPLTDINIESTQTDIENAVITSINEHKDRLAARLVERKVKDQLARMSPNWKKILSSDVKIEFSTQHVLDEEKALISKKLKERNIEFLISRYPVRETSTLGLIAKHAQFQSMEKYEQAVRKMLIDSNECRAALKKIIEPASHFLE